MTQVSNRRNGLEVLGLPHGGCMVEVIFWIVVAYCALCVLGRLVGWWMS